jgi:dolichol-phosphate mannosyltransferase
MLGEPKGGDARVNLVITPTLNERENIDELVRCVLEHEECSLLVVDDNSPDLTWQRVEDLQEKYDRLHLLRRMSNPGFRNSYLDGLRWALERAETASIITMDADLSHPPDTLPDLIAGLGEADMVIGSRYVKGGTVRNWTFTRRLLSRNANRFARAVTGMPVRDCTAGFIAIGIDLLHRLPLGEIESTGYAFLIELKHIAWRIGARISETPIVFTDRRFGATKFNSGMIGEAVSACMRLRRKK